MSNSSEEVELIVDEGDNENDENDEAAGGVSEQVYILSGNDKEGVEDMNLTNIEVDLWECLHDVGDHVDEGFC